MLYIAVNALEHYAKKGSLAEKAKENGKLTPLVDWEMSEQHCLMYCISRGFDYEEIPGVYLYKILDRVSCWCCANKNLKELKNYYKYLPKYWEKLKNLQEKTERPFKRDKTIFDLEEIFKNGNI